MNKIADRCVSLIISKGFIPEENKELYTYVFLKKVEQIIGFIFFLCLAAVFNVFLETICFYIVFSLLRRYAGGFHCNTFSCCLIMSGILYLVMIYLIFPLWMEHCDLMLITLLVSVVLLFFISVVNHPNINWSVDEYIACKKRVRINLIICVVFIYVLYFINAPYSYLAFMIYGIFLTAFLNVLAKIEGMEVKEYEKG